MKHYYSRVKYARTIAGKHGLGLVEKERLEVPYTDGKSVYVPPYDGSTDWWLALLHECFHNIFTRDFDVLKREKIKDKLLKNVLNIVVDHNIEVCSIGEYPGQDKILFKGRRSLAKKNYENLSSGVSKKMREFASVIVWDHILRATWIPGFAEIEWFDILPDACVTMVTKLLSNTKLCDDYLQPRREETDYEEQNLQLAYRILDVLKSESEEDSEEEDSDGEEGEGDGEEGDEDAQGEGEDGDGDESGKESDSDGGDSESEDDEEDGDGGVVEYADLLAHNHDKEGKEKGKYTTISYDKEWEAGGYIPLPMNVYRESGRTGYLHHYGEISKLVSGSKVSSEISKYLISLKRSRSIGGKRRGKVSRGKLWKSTAMAGTAQEGLVFQRKEQALLKNAAVSLLVDWSGSMGSRSKWAYAAASAILMSKMLSDIGMDSEVALFTSKGIGACHYIVKEFGTKKSEKEMIQFFTDCIDYMNGNDDGENIQYAAERLAQRPEKKKLLIVFSDGEPAGYNPGDIATFTKNVIRNIEQSREIDVFGIGILASSVRHFYSKYAVIERLSDLEGALLNLVKNNVIEHDR